MTNSKSSNNEVNFRRYGATPHIAHQDIKDLKNLDPNFIDHFIVSAQTNASQTNLPAIIQDIKDNPDDYVAEPFDSNANLIYKK